MQLAIAIAIALHNIPEGISVSVPIFYATGNRMKAFFYSSLSGLAEPVEVVVDGTISSDVLAEIEELIAGRDGFEVHARDPQTGKLVVVQERVSVDEHRRGLRELHALPGVLTAPTGSTTTKAIKCPPYRGSST